MRKENIFDLESIYNIGEYMTFHCHIHIFFRGYIKLISTNQITSENRQADLDLHAFLDIYYLLLCEEKIDTKNGD